MAIANGVHTRTWPPITVKIDKGTPKPSKTTNSATARIISGSTKGSMIIPMMPALAGNT